MAVSTAVSPFRWNGSRLNRGLRLFYVLAGTGGFDARASTAAEPAGLRPLRHRHLLTDQSDCQAPVPRRSMSQVRPQVRRKGSEGREGAETGHEGSSEL